MAGQRPAGQLVVILRCPAKGMNTRTQCHSAVYTASGNDNIGTGIQRFSNRKTAQIGINACKFFNFRKNLSGKHVRIADRAQFRTLGQQIIAQHNSDFQIEPLLGYQRARCRTTGFRVHAAGIGQHFDALGRNILQVWLQHTGDEVRRIAHLGLVGARTRHNRHGDFGQKIIHQIIDIAGFEQLRGSHHRLAPIAAGTANANCFCHFPLHAETIIQNDCSACKVKNIRLIWAL